MSTEFSLLRFEAAPASAAVALVELDGEFAERAPARVRLLIERGGRGIEVPAITSGGERPWSARFAIALDDLDDDRTEFALAPGRGPLIALPAPSVAGGPDEDRFLRLAREANELRHRLDEATATADEVPAVRAELAETRHHAGQESERLRSQIGDASRKADEAERAAAAARAERDDAVQAAGAAEEGQSALRARLRETEARLTETERERASLRARAESADRAVADLTGRVDELEQRARDAEAKAVAAEDETRLVRRDLRDTRARLESVLRERRHHEPSRRGHEVPEPEPAAPDPEPAGPSEPTSPTDVIEPREVASPDETTPDDDAPQTTATATRATRLVRIWDEPGADDATDTDTDTDRDSRHTPEPRDPARIGAGYIEPSQTKPSVLTPARIMVAIALLLLVAALVAIILGAGLVG